MKICVLQSSRKIKSGSNEDAIRSASFSSPHTGGRLATQEGNGVLVTDDGNMPLVDVLDEVASAVEVLDDAKSIVGVLDDAKSIVEVLDEVTSAVEVPVTRFESVDWDELLDVEGS